jgi:pseudouridine kinase
MPGRISRVPGGVALNIAMALRRFGMTPSLLSAVGRDVEGDALIAACVARGIQTDMVYRPADLPTDQYMAIEATNGLIAAIADAHSLEAAGDKILHPLEAQGTAYRGAVALDGNLTAALLSHMARAPLLAQADLRVAPASPGKALRLLPFVQEGRGTLYVNLEEAGLLCERSFESAQDAAMALRARGALRAVVTDGGNSACFSAQDSLLSQTPPPVTVTRVTGAGDTFMAAHIAAELRGQTAQDALSTALDAAALYVAGETTI